MQTLHRIMRACGVLLAAITMVYAAPASAQASRTWVSGVGDDANPCSRTAPCLTFAGAITKTNAGGEINCVDAGGYGTLLISKSITIDCTGTMASIFAPSGTGVIVNATGINVVLRGLTINGGTVANPGVNGVLFLTGASLVVLDCYIMNFGASDGNGITFIPADGATKLQVVNTEIANNRRGIFIRTSGSASANVTLEKVTVVNSLAEGLLLRTISNTGAGSFLIATDSTFAGNATGVALVTPAGTNFAVVKLVDSMISSNSNIGILADGPTVRTDVSNTTIANNGTGLSAINGAILLTYRDNRTDRNFVDGEFTGSVIER